tara:strand:- start:85 stop:390 length:306 start_codon:yes stop_codon:yes gene_type:complete
MALQVTAPLSGGATHSNAYVRVQSARVFKKADADGYKLMVDVEVYASKDERDKGVDAVPLACPAIDKFKFDFSIGDEQSNLIGLAYMKLKTLDIFDGATDV